MTETRDPLADRDPYRYPIDQWALSQVVLNAIQCEATAAYAKHGAQSMLGTASLDSDRVSILTEEAGELAEEITAYAVWLLLQAGKLGAGVGRIAQAVNDTALTGEGDPGKLIDEAVQVAAMAASLAQVVDAGPYRPVPEPGPATADLP